MRIHPRRLKSPKLSRARSLRSVSQAYCAVLLLILMAAPTMGRAQAPQHSKVAHPNPVPEAAMPAILAAFDKYEVVALPAAHGLKDMDDFTLSLIRHPAFSEKVNDIAVECGNSLYQPILDRYIDGEEVPFGDARKAWRNTSQPMCSTSGFFEQLFPLVRAINQKLPPEKRLRVLACDPPLDWDQTKSAQDFPKGFDRDGSIADVMTKQVLSKHRRALMLFGTYHLTHAADPEDPSAVSIYEKEHPGLTFVVSDLGTYDTESQSLAGSPFASWPIPSLARAKGTWLGALELSQFLPQGISIDKDCNAHIEVSKSLQRPMEDFVDAFVYFGPQDLRLKEQIPADIPLDMVYMTESKRRASLMGFPGGIAGPLKDYTQQIVDGAANPLLGFKQADTKPMVKRCLDQKAKSSTPR